jgi:NADP-dependent 3-hydroxy acid dehydrogenase YdfG
MAFFTNQVAVVTGGSSGIGKAIAFALASEGASICLLGRNLKTLEDVAAHIPQLGSVKCYQVDLSSDEDMKQFLARLQQDFEYVDIIIHSAGAFSMGTVEQASVEELDWQYKINVRGPYIITQMLLPMIKSRQGQVVFINSSAGLNARSSVSQYAATKHALKAIADSLRAEVNTYGVRVLSIYPGRTATPMQAAVYKMEGKTYEPEKLMQPKDVAEVVMDALSLPRTAEVTDIHIRPMNKIQ